MDPKKYLAQLKEGIEKLDFSAAVKAAQEAMSSGVDPNLTITEGIAPGMAVVGEKYEKGEYFLSELVVAAEVMKEAMNVVMPYLKTGSLGTIWKVVIATVEGDLHDLGKNIVTSLLKANGFEVIDLGVNIPSTKIINAVKEHNADIVGMSALLSTSLPKMGEVIQALKSANLREKVKVIVGGASVTPEYAKSIGANHKAVNALEGVKKCVEWVSLKEKRN